MIKRGIDATSTGASEPDAEVTQPDIPSALQHVVQTEMEKAADTSVHEPPPIEMQPSALPSATTAESAAGIKERVGPFLISGEGETLVIRLWHEADGNVPRAPGGMLMARFPNLDEAVGLLVCVMLNTKDEVNHEPEPALDTAAAPGQESLTDVREDADQ